MSVTNVDPMIGQLLDGRYEIVSRVARGGMATVYRAVDRRLSRAVAIKVMHEGLGDDAGFTKKFDREARSAAALSHPNVVSVFDQGHDRGRPYIVMEFVEGRTLRTVITAEAPLEPLRALQFLEPVARALAAAHEAGLVHRDVKPENVLISGRGQIKVADFGLARAITAQTATATQGLLIGTVSYLPPELVTNGRATSRSDVYSAGVVLFEMLTGRKPHVGDTPIQVAYSHVHQDVPSPSSVLAASGSRAPWQIPPYVDALVRACTNRDPLARPMDGRDLLERVLAAREALARGVLDDPRLTHELGLPSESEVTVPVPTPGTAPTVVVEASAGEQTRGQVAALEYDPSYGSPRFDMARVPVAERATPTRLDIRRVHRRRRGFVALVMVLVLALIAGAGAWWWAAAGRYQPTPRLLNLTESEARAITDKARLTLSVQQEFSDDVAAGQIIRTDPGPGVSVLREGTVNAWVSKGPEMFSVPKLVGLTQEAAATVLESTKLTLGAVTLAYDENVPAGTVLSSNPAAGAKAKHDSPVAVTVSQGPKPIDIADFTGKKTEEAKKALEKAGFSVTVTTQNSATVAAGLVISQTPASGTGKKGDAIALVSSLGPVMVLIPALRSKTVAEATAILKGLGFQVKVTYLVPNNIAFGLVNATDPAAGTKLPLGSTVTLKVS